MGDNKVGLKKSLKEILKFELLYKLLILGIMNPLLNEIYQTYVASIGVSFNKDMIGTFLNVKGLLILLALLVCCVFIIFYEYSVIINIIQLSKEGISFTLRQVLKSSFWNLKVIRGGSIFPDILY